MSRAQAACCEHGRLQARPSVRRRRRSLSDASETAEERSARLLTEQYTGRDCLQQQQQYVCVCVCVREGVNSLNTARVHGLWLCSGPCFCIDIHRTRSKAPRVFLFFVGKSCSSVFLYDCIQPRNTRRRWTSTAAPFFIARPLPLVATCAKCNER